MTKLTRRMDENLIEQAEAGEDRDDDLPPITRRLSGLLADAETQDLTEEVYRAHLEDKHL